MNFQYFRKFLFAAMFYLLLAAVSSLLNKFNLLVTDKFVQLHSQFLGFIAMLIYGLGYYLIPKLGKNQLRFPKFVPIHYWLGNLSLIAMIICHSLILFNSDIWFQYILYISIAIQIALLFGFIINLWMTLSSSHK